MGNAVKTKIYSGGFEAVGRADYPESESQTRELPNSRHPELSSAMDLFRHYIGMMFLSLNAISRLRSVGYNGRLKVHSLLSNVVLPTDAKLTEIVINFDQPRSGSSVYFKVAPKCQALPKYDNSRDDVQAAVEARETY